MTFRWIKAAVSQAVEIICDSSELAVARTPSSDPAASIPLNTIKSVMLTDQFSVSLELIVVTHEGKVYRVLNGITRSELAEVRGIITTYLDAARRTT